MKNIEEIRKRFLRDNLALRCDYIDKITFQKLNRHYDYIIGKLVRMIFNPVPWLLSEIGDKEK